MPTVITGDEHLVINSIPLATPAWRIDDLSPLGAAPRLRGDNEIMPGAPGRRGFDRIRDELEAVITIVVNGARNNDGSPTSDARQGHRDHVRTLAAGLGEGELVTAVWHQFDTSTWSTQVSVEGPLGGRRIGPYVYRYTLGILIPAGFWTADP
jgi:hypothetical protein